MNFYEFHRLLSENTVSQELKKLFKQDGEWCAEVMNIIEDKILERFGNRLNLKAKEIFAKWVFYRVKDSIRWNDIPNRSNTNKKRFIHIYFLENLYGGTHDFLIANIDQNGNWNPQLASKFNNPSFLLDGLFRIVHDYHENLKKKQKNTPGAIGKNILRFPDGYFWVDLEKGYCDVESKAMGHCGNQGAKPDDTILSLRDRKNVPHLTFILNNGKLGEMKGRGNDKPSSKYHHYIIELLKLPIIKGVVGGGYKPENNFKLSDLNDEQIVNLLKTKPELENSLLFEKINDVKPLTKEELFKLSNDSDPQIRLKLVTYINHATTWRGDHNFDEYNITKELIVKLSNDKEANIRASLVEVLQDVFESIKTSFQYRKELQELVIEILKKLTEDKSEGVRKAVAENEYTPKEDLVYLSTDDSSFVLNRIAKNNNSPPEALMNVIKSGKGLRTSENNFEYSGISLKMDVLRNKNITREILEELIYDENENEVFVQKALELYLSGDHDNPKFADPKFLLTVARDKYVSNFVKQQIAYSDKTPVEALEALIDTGDDGVKVVVAENPNVTPEILTKLALEKNKDILSTVSDNPDTPTKVLHQIALSIIDSHGKEKDDDFGYNFVSLANNPNTSSETLELIVNNYGDKAGFSLLDALIDNPNISKTARIKTKKYKSDIEERLNRGEY